MYESNPPTAIRAATWNNVNSLVDELTAVAKAIADLEAKREELRTKLLNLCCPST